MAIDFPSSPVAGQVFNASPGMSFVYRNGLWQKAPLTTALPKNYIVNGLMWVNQETSASVSTSGLYPIDMWSLNFLGVSGQAVKGAAGTGVPSGNTNNYTQSFSAQKASLAATDYCLNWQQIEGQRVAEFQWGTAKALPVIFRVSAKSNYPGTYTVAFGNAAGDRCWTKGLSLTTTYQVFTMSIPGCTDGVWAKDNTEGFRVRFVTAAGSNYLGGADGGAWHNDNKIAVAAQINGAAATAATNVIQFTDVGLYLDPYNTGVAPPLDSNPAYIQEVKRCQRYWYKAFGLGGGVTSGTTVGRAGMRHPVPMRVTPSGSVVGAPHMYDGVVTPTITSLVTVCNSYAAEFDVTTGGTFSTGGKAGQNYYIDDNNYIAMSARM